MMLALFISLIFATGFIWIWGLLFTEKVGFSNLMLLLPLVISAYGAKTVRNTTISRSFRLAPSVKSGLLGGFLGGVVTGIIIGLMYYYNFHLHDSSVTPFVISNIFVYSACSGAFIGAVIQIFIYLFDFLTTQQQYPGLMFNEVSGGLIGGCLSSCVIGILASYFFGLRCQYFVGEYLLLFSSIFGVIFVSMGSLFYEFRGVWKNALFAFFISLMISFLTSAVGILILIKFFDIDKYFYGTTSLSIMINGGALIGSLLGIVLGLQVGLTILLYRLWEIK